MSGITVKTLGKATEKGYSLIEVMLTLVVVGVGILAIVQIQSGLSGQVGDNKAKAEATSIAEARIEALRNYTNKVADLDEFKTVLLATSGTSQSVPGVNADFVRQEVITDGGDTVQVTLNVTWDDRTGTSRSITVTSEIAYVSPASSGQNAISHASSVDLIPSTGIAREGEGTFLLDDGDERWRPDGTAEVDDGTNRYLVDAEGNIRLTLEGVCQSDGDRTNCTENFTRIHGRVYIDKTSFTDVEPITIDAVNVIASNSGYCTRFVNKNSAEAIEYRSSGTFVSNTEIDLVNKGVSPMSTGTDYDYFDYTCYVSRGWYGNVGVYVYYNPDIYSDPNGQSRKTHVCIGDPTGDPDIVDPEPVADMDDGAYQETYYDYREEYALSTHRAYRGMIYTKSGDSVEQLSLRSIGVAGGIELGLQKLDTGEDNYKPMHNFVISSINASPQVTDCVFTNVDKETPGPLFRADSYIDGERGALFKGVPDDFVCLNPDKVDVPDYFDSSYEALYCPEDPTTVVVTP